MESPAKGRNTLVPELAPAIDEPTLRPAEAATVKAAASRADRSEAGEENRRVMAVSFQFGVERDVNNYPQRPSLLMIGLNCWRRGRIGCVGRGEKR
jgi:hypothetical protein